MLSCKEVAEVCSAEMERPLKLGEQLALRTHLVMCSGCTHYRKQVRTLREAMRGYAQGRAIADDPVDGPTEP